MADPVQSALDLASQDGPIHVGAIVGEHGGRTDNIPMRVPANSYVIPADVVSGMPGAEGNTTAGHRILDELLKRGAYGSKTRSLPYGAGASGPYGSALRAQGGAMPGRGTIPIIAASGEYVVPPEHVTALGGGDVKAGHKILDHFVQDVRKKNISTLRKLPGPAKR